MAELFTLTDLPMTFDGVGPDLVRMRFYCCPCRTVHEFELADVERIIYALGADSIDSLQMGASDPELAREVAAGGPECLLMILHEALDSDAYAEHVEQSVECRQAHDA